MRRPYLLAHAIAFLLVPLAALAQTALLFETVDTLIMPSAGRFPAYPPEGGRPREVFLEAGSLYDSNILRRNAGAERENVFRFGGGGRLDQRIVGRQGLRLEARGDAYLFDKFTELNHFAYSGAAIWLWELGNDLAGTLGYGRSHRLAALAETQRAIKRMVTTDDFFGTGAWRLGPSARLRGGLAYDRAVRDTPGEDRVTFGTRTATVGADWVTSLGNTLGIEHRQSRGDAPVSAVLDPSGTFANNDYKERETSVVATYVSSPVLRFNGRVGHTSRTYTDLPNNFSGPTYRGRVEWFPGNKTLLAFQAYKEARAVIDIDASHVLVRGLAFSPAWEPTEQNVFSL